MWKCTEGLWWSIGKSMWKKKYSIMEYFIWQMKRHLIKKCLVKLIVFGEKVMQVLKSVYASNITCS